VARKSAGQRQPGSRETPREISIPENYKGQFAKHGFFVALGLPGLSKCIKAYKRRMNISYT